MMPPFSPQVDIPAERVDALVQLFEHLSPTQLDQLATLYAPEVHFRDPFNDVNGLAAMRHIFADMYEQLIAPRFSVRHVAAQGSTLYLAWDFDFGIRVMGRTRQQHIEGLSECRWRCHRLPDGRMQWLVHTHWDHWDAATQVYAQLPLVGSLMRWLRRRISAS